MTETILLTQPDRDALDRLLGSRRVPDGSPGRSLRSEVDRARVVPADQIPADVVTLNSVVRLTDLDAGTRGTYALVLPGSADVRRGRLSVMAPVGTALLGQREGDVVEWTVPAGHRRFRIDAIVYQPESDGGSGRRRSVDPSVFAAG